MLEIKNLSVSYGMIDAVKNVNIKINDGEIVALIGANGAGKTTTMHAISGLIPINNGEIIMDGVNLAKLHPEKIVKQGLIQVPEGRRIFQNATVKENLKLGAYLRKDNLDEDLKHVYDLFPILKERENQLGGTLSGGEQQMLAIARALMAKPKILLLDEPSMGLAPLLVKKIFEIIKQINDEGTTIFIVEQNANMTLAIADRAYVLETGNVVLEGTGEELANSSEVKAAYLGGNQ